MVDYKIVGMDEALQLLGTIGEIEKHLQPWVTRTQATAKKETDYTQTSPPRRPGQTYIRTKELEQGWQNQTDIFSGSITVRRFNRRTPYGPYVMGRNMQTGIFRGRWPTDESIERKIGPGVIADLERTIQEALGK